MSSKKIDQFCETTGGHFLCDFSNNIISSTVGHPDHYSEVIMCMMVSQITCVLIACSIVCSGADQRKHQSSMSLAFVRAIHWWPVNVPHKGPVTWKIFPFDDNIIMISQSNKQYFIPWLSSSLGKQSNLKLFSKCLLFTYHYDICVSFKSAKQIRNKYHLFIDLIYFWQSRIDLYRYWIRSETFVLSLWLKMHCRMFSKRLLGSVFGLKCNIISVGAWGPYH